MQFFNQFISFLFGCAFAAGTCAGAPAGSVHDVSVVQSASGTPSVTVVTSIDGSTTKRTLDAPYGVASAIDSETVNGKTVTHATTTALSKEDAARMQQDLLAQQKRMEEQFAQMQQEMNAQFAQMQQLFGGF
ncbi:MAG TPA: hypothetical protein VFL98_01195 [Candidatus Paceibacterota bacterium]|nr:hypothetical protein [Candidatus Paceibacterota bacterium]